MIRNLLEIKKIAFLVPILFFVNCGFPQNYRTGSVGEIQTLTLDATTWNIWSQKKSDTQQGNEDIPETYNLSNYVVCAQPYPDSVYTVSKEFSGALKANVKSQAEGSAEFANRLALGISKLFERSQGVQVLRDGLYRLCEAYVNGILSRRNYELLIEQYLISLNYLLPLEVCRSMVQQESNLIQEVKAPALPNTLSKSSMATTGPATNSTPAPSGTISPGTTTTSPAAASSGTTHSGSTSANPASSGPSSSGTTPGGTPAGSTSSESGVAGLASSGTTSSTPPAGGTPLASTPSGNTPSTSSSSAALAGVAADNKVSSAAATQTIATKCIESSLEWGLAMNLAAYNRYQNSAYAEYKKSQRKQGRTSN